MLWSLGFAAAAAFAVLFTTRIVIRLQDEEALAAKERVGLLEKDAELLRKDNLRLEAKLSPRKLRVEQLQAIANALVGFKGRPHKATIICA